VNPKRRSPRQREAALVIIGGEHNTAEKAVLSKDDVDGKDGNVNLSQRILLLVSFLATLAMALFPPWTYTYHPPPEVRDIAVTAERPAGYRFIFNDQIPEDETYLIRIFGLERVRDDIWWAAKPQFFSVHINTSQLAMQLLVSALLTAIIYLALRSGAMLA